MKKNKVSIKILEKPYEFYKIVRKPKPQMMFSYDPEEINGDQEHLIESLKNSPFNEFFENLKDIEIINLVNEVLEEINRLKKWIQNSKIRENSFYYLGKLETATATEIGKIISKHPKSISTYLSEFKTKNWVDNPVEEGRERNYSLSDIGFSFFKLATKNGWFRNIITQKISLEQTLITIEAYELLPEINLDPKVRDYYNKNKREPDYTDILGMPHFFIYYRDYYELNYKFIEKMTPIIETIVEKFEGTRYFPKITPLENNLIAINSTDDLKLAPIFAAFNYSKKNRFKNGFYWDYSTIKIIDVDDYFDESLPDINNSEGFMSEEQSREIAKKILANYRTKIKNEKI